MPESPLTPPASKRTESSSKDSHELFKLHVLFFCVQSAVTSLLPWRWCWWSSSAWKPSSSSPSQPLCSALRCTPSVTTRRWGHQLTLFLSEGYVCVCLCVCNEACVCVSGDRASEEWEADVGASDSLGRTEVCVWRSAVSDVDQPLRRTQATNISPQAHLEGRSRVLRLTRHQSNCAQWSEWQQTTIRVQLGLPSFYQEEVSEPQKPGSDSAAVPWNKMLGLISNTWPLTLLQEGEHRPYWKSYRSNTIRLSGCRRRCWMYVVRLWLQFSDSDFEVWKFFFLNVAH